MLLILRFEQSSIKYNSPRLYSPLCRPSIGKKIQKKRFLCCCSSLHVNLLVLNPVFLDTTLHKTCIRELNSALQLYWWRDPNQFIYYCKCWFVGTRYLSYFTIISAVPNIVVCFVDQDFLLNAYFVTCLLVLFTTSKALIGSKNYKKVDSTCKDSKKTWSEEINSSKKSREKCLHKKNKKK